MIKQQARHLWKYFLRYTAEHLYSVGVRRFHCNLFVVDLLKSRCPVSRIANWHRKLLNVLYSLVIHTTQLVSFIVLHIWGLLYCQTTQLKNFVRPLHKCINEYTMGRLSSRPYISSPKLLNVFRLNLELRVYNGNHREAKINIEDGCLLGCSAV
jgi:hypothetical protein